MESQIKQLKINSTNIKNTLLKSNNQLKKLRAKERNLYNQRKINAKRLQKENFTEGRESGSGVGGYLKQKALAPTMSIIDSLKQFAGTILLGMLINTLPTAIKKVEEFLEDNKDIIETVKNVIISTGSVLQILVDIFKDPNAPDPKKLKEENKELEELKKEFEPGGKFEKEIDGLEKDVTSLNTDLRKEFRDLYTERTPEQVKEDVIETIKQSSTSSSPITRKQFVSKANQYARAKKSRGQKTALINVPGVGSYQRVPSGLFGGFFGGSKEITKDVSGNEIDPKEFDKRYNVIIKSQNEIFESLKSEGIEGYSQGGIVSKEGPSRSQNLSTQGQSAEEKITLKQFSHFLNLKDSAIKESKILEIKEKSQDEMKKAISNLKKYLEITKPKLPKSSPYELPETPPGSPPQQGPTILPPGVESKDVVGYVGSTGRSSGPHIHIETGDGYGGSGGVIPDSVLSNIIVDGNPLKSYRVSGELDENRDSGKHKGIDYAIRDGAPITLKGGLKFIEYDEGYNSGYGNSLIIEDGNGNKYLLGHLSAGPSNIEALKKLQLERAKGGPNIAPVQTSGYGKGGPSLLQSFDEPESEVVMIMSQQPIIVPGPTRYITRTVTQTMPVAVQIAPKSSGLRSLV